MLRLAAVITTQRGLGSMPARLRGMSTKVDMALVSRLRKETGIGMGICRQAVSESNNSYDDSFAWLKKKQIELGEKKISKLQNRQTSQGVISARVSPDKRFGVLLEVNCETDFAARTPRFQELIETVTHNRLARVSGDAAHVPVDEEALLKDTIAVVGENIKISREVSAQCVSSVGTVGSYVHSGRIGVLAVLEAYSASGEALSSSTATAPLEAAALLIAKQAVATNPLSIARKEPEGIASSTTASESDSAEADSGDEDKPLLEQKLLFAPSAETTTVAQLLESCRVQMDVAAVSVSHLHRLEL